MSNKTRPSGEKQSPAISSALSQFLASGVVLHQPTSAGLHKAEVPDPVNLTDKDQIDTNKEEQANPGHVPTAVDDPNLASGDAHKTQMMQQLLADPDKASNTRSKPSATEYQLTI